MATPVVTPIRVALVDDHDLIVMGLAGVLAPFTDRVTFLGRATPHAVPPAQVLLLDLEARPRGKVVDPHIIRRRGGDARILAFSWDVGPGAVRRALALGAAGTIGKSATGAQLVHAIERAQSQHPARPHQSSSDPRTWPGQEHGLTKRESQMFALITHGASNREIADALHLSINSVKTYIRTGYRKLGVTRRADAVRWAIEQGFEMPTTSLPG